VAEPAQLAVVEQQEAVQRQAVAELLPAAREQAAALLAVESGAPVWAAADWDRRAVEAERLLLEAQSAAADWLRTWGLQRAAAAAVFPAEELRSGWSVRGRLAPAARWLQVAE
jgi:hypothetical protein